MGGADQIVIGLDRCRINSGLLEQIFAVEEQTRIEIPGNTQNTPILRVDLQLERDNIAGVRLNPVSDVVEVARLDRKVIILVESAIRHLDTSSKCGGKLGVYIHCDVVDFDVGVFLVERGNGSIEDLEQI